MAVNPENSATLTQFDLARIEAITQYTRCSMHLIGMCAVPNGCPMLERDSQVEKPDDCRVFQDRQLDSIEAIVAPGQPDIILE